MMGAGAQAPHVCEGAEAHDVLLHPGNVHQPGQDSPQRYEVAVKFNATVSNVVYATLTNFKVAYAQGISRTWVPVQDIIIHVYPGGRTHASVMFRELRQAIGSVEALLAEAKRELAALELRERRATYERLHTAMGSDNVSELEEEWSISDVMKVGLRLPDVPQQEQILLALQLTPECFRTLSRASTNMVTALPWPSQKQVSIRKSKLREALQVQIALWDGPRFFEVVVPLASKHGFVARDGSSTGDGPQRYCSRLHARRVGLQWSD